jgi:tetrahydromethanopterin S-methyltransferase subunit D
MTPIVGTTGPAQVGAGRGVTGLISAAKGNPKKNAPAKALATITVLAATEPSMPA